MTDFKKEGIYFMPLGGADDIGMNMYMIEGFVPFTYMHKWYGHVYNTKLRQKAQVTDYDMLSEYIDLLEKDIKKTGIQLHTLGHAWLFSKFGIRHDHVSEIRASEILTLEQKNHIALVNGKRELFQNSIFYTHFCYSNPETRKLLNSIIIEYVKQKPYVDYVHVWLADASNNQCECEECQKMHPSNYYVMLLNELDEALTSLGLDTRIALIMYVDTARPPQIMKLKNPKRFILISAIGLNYENGYSNDEYTDEIPPYVRNQYVAAPPGLRLKWHKEWKEICSNINSVVFEYRFYTDMYCDMGHMQISRETHRDMKQLKNISFNGCMSDQTHRMYMPTSLPLIAMGETLFDNDTDYELMANTYFEGAFGKDGNLCRQYLEKLTDLLCPSNLRVGVSSGIEEQTFGDDGANKRCWRNNPYVASMVSQIPDHVDEFMPVIEKNISSSSDNARLMSWVYLKQHATICKKLSSLLFEGASGNIDKAKTMFNELRDYLSEHEMEFHNAFDLFLFIRSLSMKLQIDMPTYFE